jgi:hypothetical protein
MKDHVDSSQGVEEAGRKSIHELRAMRVGNDSKACHEARISLSLGSASSDFIVGLDKMASQAF